MSNSIKYSTTGDTQSLKKGNLFFGTGDVGKGPSSVSQHFNGVTPNSGSYTVYFYDPAQPNNIGYDPITSDVQLIRYTNGMFGQNFTTAQQCLNWYSSQTNYTCVNKDYEEIVTSGLTLNLDAGFLPSYGGSGTTWYDLSYSGNNGTLINGVTYSILEGGSLVFDGTNDYANVTSNQVITNDFTFTVWAKRDGNSPTSIGGVFGNHNHVELSGANIFFRNSSTIVEIATGNGVTRPSFQISIPSLNTEWNFYVLRYSGTTCQLYFNGVLLDSRTAVVVQSLNSNRYGIAIWASSYLAEYYLNGKISQCSVYNRALTSSEILKNYNAGLARFNTPNIVKSNLLLNLDSSNAVSYPTSGTIWTDLSGNGYTGSLINGPTFNSTSKSIVFDGTNDYFQYSARTPNTEFQYYDAFTVEALTYVNESTLTGHIVTNRTSRDGNNTPYTGWGLAQYNSSIRATIGGYPSSTFDWRFVEVTGTTFTNEVFRKWSHIVWVNTGVAGQQKIYINGVDRTNSSGDDATPPYTINYSNGTHRLTVGMSPADGSPGGHFFDGNIEVARVYNKALSQSEVLQNYYQSPIVTDGLRMSLDAGNLVSYSGAGTTWKDLTAYGYNGTLTNGPTFSGVSGGAIVFDGTDDVVTGGLNGSIFTGDFTQTAWIYKLNNNQPWQGVFTNSSPATNNTYLMTFGNGSVDAPYNSIGVNQVGVSASGVFLDIGSHLNRWLYVAISKVGSNLNIYCFKDGNLLSTTGTITWNGGNFATTNNYQIGRHWAGTNVIPFQGLISNVSLYDRALSTDEIAQNYNATKSRFGL
jgi:hypothetical protein